MHVGISRVLRTFLLLLMVFLRANFAFANEEPPEKGPPEPDECAVAVAAAVAPVSEQVERQRAEAARVAQELAATQAELAAARSQLREVQDQLSQASSRQRDIVSQLALRDAELAVVRGEAQRLQSAVRDKVSLAQRLASVNEELKRARDTQDTTSAEAARKEARVRELEAQRAATMRQLEQAAKTETKLATTQRTLEELQGARDGLVQQLGWWRQVGVLGVVLSLLVALFSVAIAVSRNLRVFRGLRSADVVKLIEGSPSHSEPPSTLAVQERR
jgi:small-conductance mechanosensitive channel